MIFHGVGDQATYLLTVNNGDNEDYLLDTKLDVSSKYIEYTINSDNTENIIKAGNETNVYITAKYINEVPVYLLSESKYSETKNLKINLVGEQPREYYTVNALPGMTWGEWLESDYNDKNVQLDNLSNISKFSDMVCISSKFIIDYYKFSEARSNFYNNANQDPTGDNQFDFGEMTVDQYRQIGGIQSDDEIDGDIRYQYVIGDPCRMIESLK